MALVVHRVQVGQVVRVVLTERQVLQGQAGLVEHQDLQVQADLQELVG